MQPSGCPRRCSPPPLRLVPVSGLAPLRPQSNTASRGHSPLPRCEFASKNKLDHLQSPVVALAALDHELIHHGYWQPSKWSADNSPSRIVVTIFTTCCPSKSSTHNSPGTLLATPGQVKNCGTFSPKKCGDEVNLKLCRGRKPVMCSFSCLFLTSWQRAFAQQLYELMHDHGSRRKQTSSLAGGCGGDLCM